MDSLIQQSSKDVGACIQRALERKDILKYNKDVLAETVNALVIFFSPSDKLSLASMNSQSRDDEEEKVEEEEEKVVKSQDRSSQNTSSSTEPEVCKEHLKKQCTKAGCRLKHPKWCHKALQHGLKRYNNKGCDKEKCDLHHPFFCRKSLINRACYNLKCKLVHVKGTKRTRPQEKGRDKGPGTVKQPQNTFPLPKSQPSNSSSPSFPQWNPQAPVPTGLYTLKWSLGFLKALATNHTLSHLR